MKSRATKRALYMSISLFAFYFILKIHLQEITIIFFDGSQRVHVTSLMSDLYVLFMTSPNFGQFSLLLQLMSIHFQLIVQLKTCY